MHKLLFLKAPSTTFTINIYIPIICVQSSSSTPTVGGMAWKYPFTYVSLSWKGKQLCTFSSHDEHINWIGHSIHRIQTFPSKQMLQRSGDGRPSQVRTASINCFLALSQLEVKLVIRVSQFLEVLGKVARTSSHLAIAVSRSSSIKQKIIFSY